MNAIVAQFKTFLYNHFVPCITVKTTGQDRLALKSLGFPEIVLEFYDPTQPAHEFTINGIRLLSVRKLVYKNIEAYPGIAVQPHGMSVVAVGVSGGAYCIQIASQKIYLVSHTLPQNASWEDVQAHSRLRPMVSRIFSGC